LQLPRSIFPLELKINSATVEKSPSQRTRPASRPKKREIPNFIKRTAITFLGSRDAISACVRERRVDVGTEGKANENQSRLKKIAKKIIVISS